ncbi:unnamed protein product [Lactuca saligna]|uniref:Uncharacterized protein n=1 Tax=Lactuca saligna TaxID=75948 RepID=A0AA35ZY83_LACSI|nr:unnamed protein product [Lactuca saligna]
MMMMCVSFADLQFDPEEEDIPNHMLISGKQFKIHNYRLNLLLRLQADVGNRNSVSGIEVDVMIKAQELCLKAMMDQMDKNNELRVDIVVDAVKRLVEYHTSLNSKEFVHLQGLLAEVKEMISKLAIPSSLTVSQESILQMFSSLENRLKADLDLVFQFINLIPMATPPVSIRVQGGEKSVGASKNFDQDKVIGKVSSIQIFTLFPVSTTTTSTTMTLKPLHKGVVIISSTCGSISKPPPSIEELKRKGKGILTEPTIEDEKLALEQEMEKQRKI